MPQSLSFLLIHVVFSTKDRAPLLDPEIRPTLHAYLATVTRNADCECFRVGGVADHVHLAIRLARTITVADLVESLKTSSSKWLKTQSPALAAFAWQRGYGAFSVGPSDRDGLLTYEALIPSPEEQHRIATFLTSVDELIAAQSAKLEALKTHKRGRMQQLFPSPSEGCGS
jgi:REP element-mobilizing transposase RayT